MKTGKDTLVYLGTVDDVVLRYPWEDIKIKEDFLIETILDHVVFGNPLLINDGYLINHPLARNDLLKGKNSLILQLVKKGFIKVLTRESSTDTIHNMPLRMASDSGIDSFKSAISQDDWTKLNSSLKKLGESLIFNYNCFRWPPVDLGDGFRILLENISKNISKKGYQTLGFRTVESDLVVSAIDIIGNRLVSNTSGARNYFEQFCIGCSNRISNHQRKLFISDMMGLANEIYHFNFGINLDYHLRVTGSNVITETRFSKSFDDLLSIEENFHQFEKNIPLLNAPNIIKNLDPSIITQLVDPSTDIGEEKLSFLTKMRAFARGEITVEEAKNASDKYKIELSSHFVEANPQFSLKNPISIGLIITGGLASAAVTGPYELLAATGIGLGFLSTFIGEPTLLRVTKRYKRKSIENSIGDLKMDNYKSQKNYTNSAMLGALKFNSEVTDPIAKNIRKF